MASLSLYVQKTKIF
nr:photosystem I subunit VIII [Leucanthemum maximum]QIJ46020.1 photosystem I subunit VIII [Leucanthemum maximum]